MSSIIAGQTWARSQRQSGGKGKWHLLEELRQSTSANELVGRWETISPGCVFGVATCGMYVIDPVWQPQPRLKPHLSYLFTQPFPVPAESKNWCLPCVEARLRVLGSRPI